MFLFSNIYKTCYLDTLIFPVQLQESDISHQPPTMHQPELTSEDHLLVTDGALSGLNQPLRNETWNFGGKIFVITN